MQPGEQGKRSPVELGKRLRIEREEIMAFGDGDNDEPMLRKPVLGGDGECRRESKGNGRLYYRK